MARDCRSAPHSKGKRRCGRDQGDHPGQGHRPTQVTSVFYLQYVTVQPEVGHNVGLVVLWVYFG